VFLHGETLAKRMWWLFCLIYAALVNWIDIAGAATVWQTLSSNAAASWAQGIGTVAAVAVALYQSRKSDVDRRRDSEVLGRWFFMAIIRNLVSLKHACGRREPVLVSMATSHFKETLEVGRSISLDALPNDLPMAVIELRGMAADLIDQIGRELPPKDPSEWDDWVKLCDELRGIAHGIAYRWGMMRPKSIYEKIREADEATRSPGDVPPSAQPVPFQSRAVRYPGHGIGRGQ
jgi:hypothetical protein